MARKDPNAPEPVADVSLLPTLIALAGESAEWTLGYASQGAVDANGPFWVEAYGHGLNAFGNGITLRAALEEAIADVRKQLGQG